MSKTAVFLTASILTIGLVIVLADEPNDANINDSIDDIVDANNVQPIYKPVRPIVLFRQLDRRIDKLERQIQMLVKDNRQQKAEIENFEFRIKRLESFHGSTPVQLRGGNRWNEPYGSRHKTTLVPKK